MADDYRQLLDATIRHLEVLKADGVRYVGVSPAILEELATAKRPEPAGQASRPAAPAPVKQGHAAAPVVRAPVASSAPPAAAPRKSTTAADSSLDLPGMPAKPGAVPVRPTLGPEAK